jgi:predicted dehydrogenase
MRMSQGLSLRKIKVAFGGVAHFHSESYARAIRELPDASISAVYDQEEKRGRRFARQYGIKYFSNFDSLLSTDIDAVVITSETAEHHDLARKAARAGKNILCEKPIAINVKQATSMIKTAQEHKIVFQMCHVMRFHSTSILVKSFLDEGRIGELRAAVGTNKLKSSLPLSARWFTNRRLSGGGAVIDHSVHLTDLITWFSGSRVKEVYTEIGRNLNTKLKVEDNFLTTLTLEDGVVAHIDGSWSFSEGYPSWGDFKLDLTGTEGFVQLNAFEQNLSYSGMKPPTDKLSLQYYGCDADKEMVASFIKCVASNLTPVAIGSDGLEALKVAIASYESARKGAVVRIEN